MIAQVWWFATRSAGLMTWATSTASVVVGLLLASRALGRRPTGAWLLDLHRYLGGLTMVFLALHMVTLWADSYVEFGLAELVVPGASSWRTGAVAWGIVAAWLVAAIEVSSLIKDRLPRRLWQGIHLGSFAVMGMGTIHGWQAGSDVGNLLVMAVAAVMALAVAVLAGQRLRLRADAEAAKRQRRAALVLVRHTAAGTSAPATTSPTAGPVPETPSPAAPAAPTADTTGTRSVATPSDRRGGGVHLPPRGVAAGAAGPLPVVSRLRPSAAASGAGDVPALPRIAPPAQRRSGPTAGGTSPAPAPRRPAGGASHAAGGSPPAPARRGPGPRPAPRHGTGPGVEAPAPQPARHRLPPVGPQPGGGPASPGAPRRRPPQVPLEAPDPRPTTQL